MNRIIGKTAVITGASSGIGEACARAFAARGANLVLLARREDRLEALEEDVSGNGVEVITRVHDVRDRAAAGAFATDLEDRGIVPDILLNNAGLARGLSPIHEGEIDDWRR